MAQAERSQSPRRTQEERSASTRALLLDTTIDCLVELGYAATTTTVIAERAGLSRGAQLHHYPTKAELVAAAVEHLADKIGYDLAEEAAHLPDGNDRVSAVVDALWARYSTPLFNAWLELSTAARTDPELRAALVPVEKRLRGAIDRQARRLFGSGAVQAGDEELIAITFCIMQGMALERSVGRGRPSREAAMLATGKEIVGERLASRRGSTTSSSYSASVPTATSSSVSCRRGLGGSSRSARCWPTAPTSSCLTSRPVASPNVKPRRMWVSGGRRSGRDVAQPLVQRQLPFVRCHDRALHHHQLAHVAFDSELTGHERLHRHLRIAVDEQLTGDVIWHRRLRRRAFDEAPAEVATLQVELLIAVGAVGHDDVQGDARRAGRGDVVAHFAADPLRLFEPLVGQEGVGHVTPLDDQLCLLTSSRGRPSTRSAI
jgi:AcrR family transcriptional regulator